MKKMIFIFMLIILLFSVSACSREIINNKSVNPESTNQENIEKQQTNKLGSKKNLKTTKEDSNSKMIKTSNENIELVEKSVLNDKVKILIPKEFDIMAEDMAKFKYPSERRPNLIFTNDIGSVNIAFNHTVSKATNEQIYEYRQMLKRTFDNMYPSAVWYGDNIITIDGKNVGNFEFLTPAIDTKIYNNIFFTELDGRLLMGTFNCTEEQMNDWKVIAKEIVNSLRTK